MSRILVVDDEAPIRDVMRKMLEKSGYEVVEAGDGREALQVFETDPTDLVITDILMPDQEGLQTIMELRQNHPDLKIIAISGGGVVGPQTYLRMAEGFGADRTLTKPFTMNDLIEAVRALL